MSVFGGMPHILAPSEIINKAFGRGRKASGSVSARYWSVEIKVKELKKMEAAADVVTACLDKILNGTPDMRKLSPFYRELVSVVVDIDDFRKSLGAVKWARELAAEMLEKHKVRAKGMPVGRMKEVRTQYFGRLSSVLKQIGKNLKHLEECRIALKELPVLKEMNTVVIAGVPNAGKSSLLMGLTGAKPEIKPYPFTTKKILVGYIDKMVQVIDTPGLLDRSLSERNKIELRAVLALKHLANTILFVFDASLMEHSFEEQMSLYSQIKEDFNAKVVVCANKMDIARKEDLERIRKTIKDPVFFTKSPDGEGIGELKKLFIKEVYPSMRRA